jgi:hypothetical protein
MLFSFAIVAFLLRRFFFFFLFFTIIFCCQNAHACLLRWLFFLFLYTFFLNGHNFIHVNMVELEYVIGKKIWNRREWRGHPSKSDAKKFKSTGGTSTPVVQNLHYGWISDSNSDETNYYYL